MRWLHPVSRLCSFLFILFSICLLCFLFVDFFLLTTTLLPSFCCGPSSWRSVLLTLFCWYFTLQNGTSFAIPTIYAIWFELKQLANCLRTFIADDAWEFGTNDVLISAASQLIVRINRKIILSQNLEPSQENKKNYKESSSAKK